MGLTHARDVTENDILLTDAFVMRNDYVLLKRAEVLHITKGGIALPDRVTHGKGQPLGIVLKVGPGRWDGESCRRVPIDLEEGDHVVYQKISGKEIDATLLAQIFTVREHEIIMKIPEDVFLMMTKGHTQIVEDSGPEIQVVKP